MKKEISGTIDDWGSPIIDCYIANVEETKSYKVIGLIDTGSYHFHLKKQIIDNLELESISKIKSNLPMAGIEDLNAYSALASIGKGVFNIVVCHMKDTFNYDFIIGTQFIKGKNFSYNWENKIWTITFNS
jgi:hypothetical protein